MSNTKLSSDEALELLVGLIRRLFDDKIPRMKEAQIKRRFEKELFIALETLAATPSGNIDKLPVWVQRLVYEMLTQYVMFYGLQPGADLCVDLSPDMTENEKVSAILVKEILPNSWPYPQSVPF